MRSLMPSLAKKSRPTCVGTFWKVPLGGYKSLDLFVSLPLVSLQHASAVKKAPSISIHCTLYTRQRA